MIGQRGLLEEEIGSIPAVLADIAHTLSSIDEWRGRVSDSMALLCGLLPGSTALLGAQIKGWELLRHQDQADSEELERLILRHYEILTGDEAPSIIARNTPGGGAHPAAREADGASASFLSMPVIGADKVVGILHVRSDERNAYSIEDISLVSVVASQIGSYITNVMAYESEQQARREIERLRIDAERNVHMLRQALLPAEPTIGEGYDVASAYVPGLQGQEIGGDFYDVFPTEDGKVCVFIGDVSGKGIPAASMAAATRSTLRAFAHELGTAGEVLTHTNRVLAKHQAGQGLFVTAFLVILDPVEGCLGYCGAGHPPAALYSGGEVEMLTFGYPPLGTSDSFKYEEAHTCLKPGDKLILYTDGITEARDGHEMFETEGVVRVVREHGEESADDVVGQILAAATGWAKGRITDDIAVVVIGRRRKSES